MYQGELYHEAKLMTQGRWAWVRNLATFWARFVARLGIGAAKSPPTDLRLH